MENQQARNLNFYLNAAIELVRLEVLVRFDPDRLATQVKVRKDLWHIIDKETESILGYLYTEPFFQHCPRRVDHEQMARWFLMDVSTWLQQARPPDRLTDYDPYPIWAAGATLPTDLRELAVHLGVSL